MAAGGIPIGAYVIGREYQDLFGHWAAMREVAEVGCLLVRPDMHIAWRSPAGDHLLQPICQPGPRVDAFRIAARIKVVATARVALGAMDAEIAGQHR